MWLIAKIAVLIWMAMSIAVLANGAWMDSPGQNYNYSTDLNRNNKDETGATLVHDNYRSQVHHILCQAFEDENKARGKVTSAATMKTGPLVQMEILQSQGFLGGGMTDQERLATNCKVVLQAVKQDGFNLPRGPLLRKACRNYRQITLEAVKQNGLALELADIELINDRQIVLEAVKQNAEAYELASEEARAERQVALQMAREDGQFLLQLCGRTAKYPPSRRLLADREVVLAAVQQNGFALEYASRRLKNDCAIVLAAVQQDGRAWRYASEKLQADRQLLLEAVRTDGSVLSAVAPPFIDDRQIVLEAVTQYGLALRDASREFQRDREVVLAAVTQNGDALAYASAYTSDRQVVLQAVRSNGVSIQYASKELQGDRQVVLEAVQQNGKALYHASRKLQDDREVVLKAVQQNGEALYYAARVFRDDRQVVLQAVQQADEVLYYASRALQGDRQVVLKAVQKNGKALSYASWQLRGDRQVVLAAVQQNGEALCDASQDLKRDKYFILDIMKHHSLAARCCHQELQNDQDFIAEAMKVNAAATLELMSCADRNRVEVRTLAIRFARTYEECKEVTRDSTGLCGLFSKFSMLHDRGVLLELARNSMCYLPYPALTKEYRCDEEIAALAMLKDVSFVEDICEDLKPKLWANRSLVISAVQHHADILGYAPQVLRGDWELIAIAAAQGKARQYCNFPGQFHGERRHALQALQWDGMLLWCASAAFKDDDELVAVAVNQSGCALDFSSEGRKSDADIVSQALGSNGLAFVYASEEIKSNRSMQLQALRHPSWNWLLQKVMHESTSQTSCLEECNNSKIAIAETHILKENEANHSDIAATDLSIQETCLAILLPVLSDHPLLCSPPSPHHSSSSSVFLSTVFIVVYSLVGCLGLLAAVHVTTRALTKGTLRIGSKDVKDRYENAADLERVLLSQSTCSSAFACQPIAKQ